MFFNLLRFTAPLRAKNLGGTPTWQNMIIWGTFSNKHFQKKLKNQYLAAPLHSLMAPLCAAAPRLGITDLRSSVPCLQTSLYRLIWIVYQVHRPLITGHPSGLGELQSLPISLYRSPIAGAKFTDHYRSLLIRKMKKRLPVTALHTNLIFHIYCDIQFTVYQNIFRMSLYILTDFVNIL